MLNIANKGGGGQTNFQQNEFQGTKNVGWENNWFKHNHIYMLSNMQIGP